MNNMYSKKKNKAPGFGRLNNQGVTMVETLVAFTVLMIVLGILYGIIAFCSTLRMRAQDTNKAVQTFEQEMYNSNLSVGDHPEEHISIKEYTTSDNKPLFYLSVNTDETARENFGAVGTKGENHYKVLAAEPEDNAQQTAIDAINNAKKAFWLSLVQIDAVTYKYLPGDVENADKIIVPKAVRFVHKKDKEDP